jgi:hypothetical protein
MKRAYLHYSKKNEFLVTHIIRYRYMVLWCYIRIRTMATVVTGQTTKICTYLKVMSHSAITSLGVKASLAPASRKSFT